MLGGGGGGNVEVMEMLIPGNKCGVVIGKGGETIKRLNEEYGVKMILIQDADTPLQADKPLRITGEPDRVARVKDAIAGQCVSGQSGYIFIFPDHDTGSHFNLSYLRT